MSLPRHIAIICDGNRRWAKNKSLPEFAGHRRAVEVTMEQLIDRCVELKIPYLTFWVFSTENWHRGKSWVDKYFKLLRQLFTKNFQKLHQKNVKLNLIGDVAKLPKDIQDLFNEWLNKTKNNQKLTLTIAINYGGRDEILRAIAKGPFPKHLDTVGLPDPDLLIRTSGELRISNFLLWQLAYAELYFVDVYWPDFGPIELRAALESYRQRRRRFGLTAEQMTQEDVLSNNAS